MRLGIADGFPILVKAYARTMNKVLSDQGKRHENQKVNAPINCRAQSAVPPRAMSARSSLGGS